VRTLPELLALERLPRDEPFTIPAESASKDVLGYSGAIFFVAGGLFALVALRGRVLRSFPIDRATFVTIALLLGVLSGIVMTAFHAHEVACIFDGKSRRVTRRVRLFRWTWSREWPFEDVVEVTASGDRLVLALASGHRIRFFLLAAAPRAAKLVSDLVTH
jgi:hypothetical protein